MNNKDRQEIRRIISVLEMGEEQENQQRNFWSPSREATVYAVEGLKVLIGETL